MSLTRLTLVSRQELAYNIRRPMFYILLLLVGFLIWGISAGNVQIIIASGDASVGGKKAWLTSEFAITQIIAILTLTLHVFFFVAAAGTSVIRDGDAKVGEILHATPLTPNEYVWGKFTASLLTFMGVIAVQLLITILLFHAIPNRDMIETRGPFQALNYLRPALIMTLPVVIFYAGTSFAIGTISRKAILVFVLPVALVLLSFFFFISWSPSWLDERVNHLLMWLDPTGIRWLRETWLEVDRGADFYNTQRIGYDLPFLASRLIFGVVGLAAVAITGRHFSRAMRRPDAARSSRAERQQAPAETPSPVTVTPPPVVATTPRPAGLWALARYVARAEARELRSQPGLYLFVPLIIFETLVNSFNALGPFETPILFTAGALAVGQMNLLTTMVTLLLIFYTVESMERERSTGMASIHNALPIPTTALVFGKAIAISLVGVLVAVACFVGCVIAILVQGKVPLTVTPFALVWGLLLAPTFFAWTFFVMAAYSLTKNRFSAYGLCLAVFGFTVYRLITSQMNWLGNWPLWGSVQWSDMSWFEMDRTALLLNRVMVFALGVVFAVIAVRYFPRRDRDSIRILHALRPVALRRAFIRSIPLMLFPLLAGGALWRQMDTGPNGARNEKQAKDYWKKNLATWKDVPAPAVSAVEMDLTIEPSERAWSAKGSYVLVNKDTQAMPKIPMSIGGGWTDLKWTIDGKPVNPDSATMLRVFTLPQKLQPGDSIRLGFSYKGRQTGATENGGGAGEFIVPSGVVMTSFGSRWFPIPGYMSGVGIKPDENDYEPKQYADDFYEGTTRAAFGSELPMTTRITITTPPDFIANSVGEKVSDTVRAGRRTVVWVSDHPVMAFNVIAGRWAVKRGTGTALYYHPEHTFNVEEMSEALDAARKYYGEWFGAFPWKELKVSEFPALATYAQGFPTNISFSEAIGFLTKSEPKTNLAFLVTAHETAHQWWGNMLQPGEGPSGNILSEGMAHFSTAMLIEQVKGFRNGLEFRKRIESRYGDTRQSDAERPLLRIDGSKAGDGTVQYDKGGWVFWMLTKRMGRESALRGMREFITAHTGNPDHAVLHDFVEHMRGYATDTASYNEFARQWFDTVVVPEYRVPSAKTVKQGSEWVTTATVENVGTGRMPIEVAVVRGERFPDDTTKVSKKPYTDVRTSITLGSKEKQTVVIKSAFEPEKVVVDPDVTVLQLRRKSAEAKVSH